MLAKQERHVAFVERVAELTEGGLPDLLAAEREHLNHIRRDLALAGGA